MGRNKIIKGCDITTLDFQRFPSMGVTPYVYLSNGTFEIVELTKENYMTYGKNRVYLLNPDEYDKVKRYVDSVNGLIDLYDKHIDLLKEMIPSVIDESWKK